MDTRKAVLMMLAGIATVALAFGVACGGSDEPPDRDSRDRDEPRAERATRRASEDSRSSQAPSVSGSGVEPTALPTDSRDRDDRRAERATRRASEDSRSSQAPSVSGSGVEPTALPRVEPTVDPSNPFGAIVATPAVAPGIVELTPTEVPTLVPTSIPTPPPTAIPTPPPFTGPPLHQAVFEGNQEKVEELLNLGEDVNATDGNGKTPLYLAVEQGNPDIAGLLLTWEAHLAAPTGWELLHVAAATGSVEVAGLLLDRGADIEAYGYKYWKPLYVALEQHYPEVEKQMGVIREIVKEYATVVAVGESASLPLRGEAAPYGWRALHVAAAVNDAEMVGLLLGRGADIEARNTAGWSPLHIAIAVADGMELAGLLLDLGADIEAAGRGSSVRTPLQIAVEQNQPQIATMLLDRGADAKAVDNRGNTPCQVARNLGRFTLTPLLGRLCRP